MTRVTVSAPEFAELVYQASDHYVRLLLPRPAQTEPLLPIGEHWWPEMVAMPAGAATDPAQLHGRRDSARACRDWTSTLSCTAIRDPQPGG